MGSGNQRIIICQSELFKNILAPGASDKMPFVGPSVIDGTQQKEKGGVASFGGKDIHSKVEAFLMEDLESKPVYCGWGSMICKSPQHMIKFVVKSLQICGERGIVLGGVAGLSLELLKMSTTDNDLIAFAEKNILFLQKASHENLFPHMKCIVHHGGAGTTNAALRSGVPSIITPVFLDQFDHSHVLNELGIGIGLSSKLQQITPEELGKAIRDVVDNPEISIRAKEVQTKILQEDGAKVVVSEIEKLWNTP